MGVKARRIKVEGWFVIEPNDGAFKNPLSELKQDGIDGDWGINELDDLKLTEEA